MKLFMSLSSRISIDPIYFEEAHEISKILSKKYDLVVGLAMKEGMAGKVIENFKNNNRLISLKTLKLYNEDPEEFKYLDFEYVETTMDRTKRIYEDSDILLMMPGGTGSLSEIFAFLEEKRTKKDKKEIILYNLENFYSSVIELINHRVKNKFNDEDIFNYLKVFNKREDVIRYLEEKEEN